MGYNFVTDLKYGSFVWLLLPSRSAKFRENVNLYQFKVIDLGANRKYLCNFKLLVILDVTRTVIKILTQKPRK